MINRALYVPDELPPVILVCIVCRKLGPVWVATKTVSADICAGDMFCDDHKPVAPLVKL